MICNECETVARCSKHGCIPKQSDYKGAIEVSVIFHEGQRMFAVPKQPAQRHDPVAVLLVGQDSDGRYVSIAAKAYADTLPLGEYKLYTSPPAQRKPLTGEEMTEGCRSLGVGAYHTLAAAFEAGVRFAEAAHGVKGEPT